VEAVVQVDLITQAEAVVQVDLITQVDEVHFIMYQE
jgi:hypothetical protein